MTGQSARPPITLGSAPSMPATATTTRAPMMASMCESRRWMPETPTS